MKFTDGALRIDISSYARKAHFDYFCSFPNPYVGLTANVDITSFMEKRRTMGAPFFLSLLYCAERAANSVPELRQRIIDGEIWEFPICPSSHTVAKPYGTYGYCVLESGLEFADFLPKAIAAQELCRESGGIDEDDSAIACFFISSMPWVSYTALVQPVPCPADSNVRISWGKYFAEGDRILLPVTLLCHHGLVDGLHIGRFYEALDRELSAF